MDIEVHLIAETRQSTLSKMRINGTFFCFVLEDGYREKKVFGETRIPDGCYNVAQRKEGKFYERYKKDYGHEFVPHIENVPGFEYILIHMGNGPKDTHGCLLVGDSALFFNSVFYIPQGSSRPCYERLYMALAAAYQACEKITITLNRNPSIPPIPISA